MVALVQKSSSQLFLHNLTDMLQQIILKRWPHFNWVEACLRHVEQFVRENNFILWPQNKKRERNETKNGKLKSGLNLFISLLFPEILWRKNYYSFSFFFLLSHFFFWRKLLRREKKQSSLIASVSLCSCYKWKSRWRKHDFKIISKGSLNVQLDKLKTWYLWQWT